MFEYISHQIGQPRKLVIFLHGYNGTPQDHEYVIDWLKSQLKDSLLIIPLAPEISDKNPEKRQWFGMLQYDAENLRAHPQTSSKRIFTIYNSAAQDVDHRSSEINQFIDQLQQQHQISDSQTYLLGFSQGAMLTIYTALSRQHSLAAAFALSGLIAGSKLLNQKISSRPPLYLFHGEQDMKVQYKTLPDSISWLQKHHIEPIVQTYPELAHRVCEAEIKQISAIINQ